MSAAAVVFAAHADMAVLEARVPHPPIQRIEVLDADARFGTTDKLATQHQAFRNAIAFTGLDAELHPFEHHVGITERGGKRFSVEDGVLCPVPAVQRQPHHPRVPGAVIEYPALRRSIPRNDSSRWVFTDNAYAHGLRMLVPRDIQSLA